MATLRLITFSRPLPLLAAEAKGFLAAEGLEVECEQTKGSREQVRGLLAGRWDIAHTAADNVMAYVDGEGADLFVFLVADLGLAQKLIVRPGIDGYEGLRGKVLGVDALDTGYAFVLRKMLALHGVRDGECELVSIGGTQQRLEALLDGRVAGCLLSTPQDVKALEAGCRILDPARRHFPLYPGLTAAATRRWEREHRRELLGYTRALLAGSRWAAEPGHEEEAVELIARDQGVDAAAARRLYEREVAVRNPGIPGLEEVREALEVVRRLRHEMTGKGTALSAYFEPEYMKKALAGPAL